MRVANWLRVPTLAGACALGTGVAGLAPGAYAQAPDFYKGRTVEIVIGYSADRKSVV